MDIESEGPHDLEGEHEETEIVKIKEVDTVLTTEELL